MHKRVLLLPALVAICLASCTRDTKCINPEYYTLAFTGSDTAGTIELFTKGTNFASRVDSFYANTLLYDDRTLVKLHLFQEKDINTFDWRISLIPSGRVVKVTDITIVPRELRLPQSDNRRCTNNVSLLANGTMYTAEGRSDVTSSVSFDIK